jgi:hypothetical protein
VPTLKPSISFSLEPSTVTPSTTASIPSNQPSVALSTESTMQLTSSQESSTLQPTTNQSFYQPSTTQPSFEQSFDPTIQPSVKSSTNSNNDFISGNGDIATFAAPSPFISGQSLETTSFVGDGINVTNNNQFYEGLTPEDLAYLSTNITKVANTVTTSTVTFIGASFLEPSVGSQLPPTSVSNFSFFVNGIALTDGSISGFGSDGGGNLILTVNTGNLGYTLVSTDEVTAIGKFA